MNTREKINMNNLKELFILVNNKYNNSLEDILDISEESLYKSFDLSYLLDILNKYDELYFSECHSILDEIDNTYSPVLVRIYNNIASICYKEVHNYGNDAYSNFSESILNAERNRYFIINNINKDIINLFDILLFNHIKSSNDTNYINRLKKISRDINFKYKNFTEYNNINEKEYIKDNIKYEYIDYLIRHIILTILSYNDNELEDNNNYAMCIIYQTLIRALLIILNDDKYLIKYEEFYNNNCKNETISKSIVRTAFINNYYDIKDMCGIKRRNINGYGK